MIELATERLRLRQWQASDLEPFAALNADPRVMEFFPALLTRAESDDMAERIQSLITREGWGLWAVELTAEAKFIGFVGLNKPPDDFPFSPCVEVGWRLAYPYWGHGYAPEAARAAVNWGFHSLGLNEIVAFTTVGNRRSRAVMEKLGMSESGTFDHPHIPEGSYWRPHCLYRLASTAPRA